MNIKKYTALILLINILLLSSCARETKRAETNSKILQDHVLILDPAPNEKDIFWETRISFAAAGDNIIHEAVFTDAKNSAAVYASNTGKQVRYRFADMFGGIADIIKEADIAYINHETPVAGDSFGIKGYPDFNAPSEVGDDLAEVGFDIINIANNHMLDMGEAGLRNSISYWKEKAEEKSLKIIGGYTKADYDNVRYIEKDGVKIALLSYTTFINDKHKNSLSSNSELKIPYANEADMTRQVGLAKEGGADLVIVSMHWGVENQFQPNAAQKRYASHLASLGVDVILGSHSHTLQPIEWIDGKDGHRTLCAYSLGNCLSTMLYSYYMVGGILTFDIVMNDVGETVIENPILIPMMCHYSMTRDSLKLYTLENYTDALVSSHGAQLNGAFTMRTLHGYVTDTIDSEFLPEYFK
ncbi:MAG: CapA family protein [Clostridia bacterium]|nr:CapA family protein [Clostridia bacterium]